MAHLLISIYTYSAFLNRHLVVMSIGSMRAPRIAVIRRSLYTELGKSESHLEGKRHLDT